MKLSNVLIFSENDTHLIGCNIPSKTLSKNQQFKIDIISFNKTS